MVRFTLLLTGIVLLVLAATEILALAGTSVPSFRLETTLLLATSVWVAVKKLLKISDPMAFAQAYLGSIVLQLLVWVGYAGAICYLDRTGAKVNAVYFLFNCLIFIALEVIFLYRKYRG